MSLLKDLTPEQYSRVSRLLDDSLDMAPEDRESWLFNMEGGDPAVAAALRELFAAQGPCRAEGFLEHGQPVAHLGSRTDPPAAMAGRQFGPYRVLSLLGHGGMGGVWLAERVDGLFTRRVALKLPHPALMDRVMTERLAREREILASLDHPNIARLFDAGFAEDGQPYLALEYVAGTQLTNYCDARRLPIVERLKLFRQILGAVQYAHANLVIHRDLKPSNILVTEEGHSRLLDFGIAKLLTAGTAKETELTQLGGRPLTLDYAAPEQVAGAPITTAADVYALGVMLYELLTGQRPYRPKRDSRGALEEAILQDEPVAPSRVALSDAAATARGTTVRRLTRVLRGDLDTIALKALKKTPSQRYTTADAFAEDIGRYLQGDVVLAQPDSVAYRAIKFVSRHRVAIAVASVLLLSLAGGLTATTYEAGLAAQQRDAALAAHYRLLTQTAAEHVKQADLPTGMGVILEVLGRAGRQQGYSPEALSVFQQARAVDAQLMALTGHAERVRSVAFSPDGGRLVTASYDGTARIWDAGTGREIAQLSGHADRVRSAVFTPDGTRVITGSSDKTARVWDSTTGRALVELVGHTDGLRTVAISPDGMRVVTASQDKTARVWDIATGKQLLILSGHAGQLNAASFSPDGNRIVTASTDRTARVWDSATGKLLLTYSGHAGQLTWAEFSPDGRDVVTASYDKTARVWDAATGQQLLVLSGHAQLLEHAEFSRDGRYLVTASDDKTARVWDVASGRQLLLFSGHLEPVIAATFSPDGRRVATASDDRTVRLWNATSGQGIVLSGHTQVVAGAEFSPDGRLVATGSADKTARIWDAVTGREVRQLLGHSQLVLSAAFSPDNRRVVTASDDGTARIWDAASGAELMTFSGHTQSVEGAAFSPDGKRVVTASSDKTVRIWDAATGKQLLLLDRHTGKVNWAVFSPDGASVLSASYDKTARLWNASSGQQTMVFAGHSGPIATAAFSPDGRRVVTASDDETARVWDVATGREIVLLSGHTQPVTSAAFSPDGRRVVTSSYDKTARIWDASTGQLLKAIVNADQVETAAFSPDGQRVVTASDDKLAVIWDARAPPLEEQIRWAQASQFEPLSSTERFQLGLPEQAAGRRLPGPPSKCDEAAAAPYDPNRRAQGVMPGQLVAEIALVACRERVPSSRDSARLTYQQGRALFASGDFAAARRNFERALAEGYRAAGIDLAMLLARPSSGALDSRRAITLYEQAWNGGVAIAAFELASLYEHGISAGAASSSYMLAPDEVRAWSWYEKGAAAGEPQSLARTAERFDDAALSAGDDATRREKLLAAFVRYAEAADRAAASDWPDELWRGWRYRRASLARVLANEGMMQNVARAYTNALPEGR